MAVIIDHLAELAEALSEAKLILHIEMLVAKEQHAVSVPGIDDVGKLCVDQRCAQINAQDFGPDRRRERDRGHGADGGRRFLRKVRFHVIRLCLCVLAASWPRSARRIPRHPLPGAIPRFPQRVV